MCGIAGIYGRGRFSGQSEMQASLESMTDVLEHRGPDSRGVWLDWEAGVGLGHRRLAIRDLSPSGAQPMTSSCGRYVIAYNGEVYSHLEMKNQLAAHGRIPQGTSDTEVVLESCAQWGVEAALSRMIGMFAFAIFDREERVLYLARDRLGIKPLYWGLVGGRLIFGSELKALRQVPGWEPRLDRHALAAFMRHNYIPAPHTIYQDVHKLEPGCLLAVGPDLKPRLSRYWDCRSVAIGGVAAQRQTGDEDLLAELDALLSDAVGRRMVSDVPLGALLSGGIDSSLVTCLMAEQSGGAINTFSIGFDESGYDEAPYARAIAERLGTIHTELYVEPGHALDLVDGLATWYDEPFADSSQIPTIMVCALTKQHVTVVLSGDGGDELFAGYPRYDTVLSACHKADRVPRQLRSLFAKGVGCLSPGAWDALAALVPGKRLPDNFGTKLHKLAAGLSDQDMMALYRQILSHWHQPDQTVLGAREHKGVLWDEALHRKLPDLLDCMQFLDTVTYLPDDILTKVDRASMRVALEVRVPLLDHRVVEMAWQLPQHMKMRGRQTKWALRQLLYKRLPRELIERPKMGFGVPIHQWLRGPLLPWARELLDPERLRSQGLFNPGPINERWQAHQAGANWAYPLWNVLMVQAWLEANPEVVF
ncbi:MAG: asparagine synthase (glutamine-hydrolyzing) [Desulfarculaceae bacterium]|nr:asparagine synthase (glutamine-hydrolyzing) [Desulfarculaceae bacterium]MCF8047771.1 asparagine synthase (glutamine-hydrolyzing) [Desulfarculaceae bacterium]MCF8122409.1 asparagine synthase (glutamine-hydrolyzing) [Desulfarculaceae bacterium]